MKVRSGGGGIDAEGNWYTLPETEREIPNGAFEEAIKKIFAAGTKPTVILTSQAFMEALSEPEREA